MECGQNVNIFSVLRELEKENKKDTKSQQNHNQTKQNVCKCP